MTRYLGIILVVLSFMAASVSGAATFSKDPLASKMSLKLSALEKVTIDHYGPGSATLTSGDTVLNAEANIWSTTGFGPGTSLFTGVPILSHLIVTMANPSGTYQAAGTSNPNAVGAGSYTANEVTGQAGSLGTAAIIALGAKISLPMNDAGIGGVDALVIPGVATIDLTYDRWYTGTHNMTDITTNVVQLPGRVPVVTGIALELDPASTEEVKTYTTAGGFITDNPNGALKVQHTVTVPGSWDLGASGTGTITLVTPIRIDTKTLVGKLPGVVRQKFSFVPEPGTLMLLVSGAAGLLLVGRRHMKK